MNDPEELNRGSNFLLQFIRIVELQSCNKRIYLQNIMKTSYISYCRFFLFFLPPSHIPVLLSS